ncbi:GntR family transcriptional regulator [Pseudomonas sp. NPDC089569]|uniref:GntR family transcriptional regulator n=1 Tax=Pseudomonas sp. NPDC089569 TaxID=3390722 RepID=UPI003D01498F
MPAKRPLHDLLTAEPLFPSQAREAIERRLRNAILDGTLIPGTVVRQQDVADLFSVSRMPAREAMRQLEAQGLLVGTRHRGVMVGTLAIQGATPTALSKSELLAILDQYPEDATFHFAASGPKVEFVARPNSPAPLLHQPPAETAH